MGVHSARADVAIGDVTSGPSSTAECAWNEYQNEYQTDSCGYVRTCSDTHGLALEACKTQCKRSPNRAIPTLASIPNCMYSNGLVAWESAMDTKTDTSFSTP